MKRLLLRCLTSISLLFYYSISQGAIFTIANGDIAGLISAMETARDNGDNQNTINLATNGLYVFVQMYEVVSSGGKDLGATALPRAGTNKVLIINGNGSTFRRSTTAPAFRFFFARQNTTLKLNNLNLENGQINSSEAGGGAVYVHFQTTFEANNCKFVNNRSPSKFGGAIYVNSRNTVFILNCDFEGNETYRHGGAIYNVLSDLTIENSIFKNNSTKAPTGRASGGAVYIDGGRVDDDKDGIINIRDSRFEGNQANPNSLDSNEGGGLYVYGYNNNIITIERCSIINNQTKGYGGGMLLDNESIDDIKPNNVKITVRDCLIANNKTVVSQGGGLYCGGVQVQEPVGSTANTKLINCTIVNNEAGSYGGGITNTLVGLDIMNCTIAYNQASQGGGGIYYKDVSINLRNSIIAYNKVGTVNDNTAGCRTNYQGGNNIQYPVVNGNVFLCTTGIIVADPKLGPLQDNGGSTMTMALLAGSPAIDAGGSFSLTPNADQRGVLLEGPNRDIGAFEASSVGVTVNSPSNLAASSTSQTQIHLTWVDNSTNETSFILERSVGNNFNFITLATLPANTLVYDDLGLNPNTTYYYRIRAEGGESIEWSTSAGATTNTNRACDNTLYKPIIITNPTAKIGNETPASCTQNAIQAALNLGGKVVCNCGTNPITINLTQELTINVSGTVFDGGGLITLNAQNTTRIFNVKEGIDFTLQNVKLINGKAPNSGGLFAESGGAILIGSGVTGNGGGEVKIINCDFENNTISNINTAERGGGAIYAYRLRNLIISESDFTNNTANVGGAIAGLGTQTILINTNFTTNEAAGVEANLSGVGGAIYLDGIDLWDLTNTQNHTFSVCGNNFTGNKGKHEGGAIYVVVSDAKKNQVKIDKSSFENNQLISTLNGNGGAIFHVEDDYLSNAGDVSENLIVTNSTFNNNTCLKQGGAIWTITGGGGRIENCTFESNKVTQANAALGGAIVFASAGYGGAFVLNNNTFANNTSAYFAGAIFGSDDNTINIRNSIFSKNTSDFEFEGHQLAGPATITGTANIQFPENRWNGTPDDIIPGRISINDPLLSPLTFNGGFTKTMALQTGSEAINNINASSPTTTDQRGLSAVGSRDLGAFEFGAVFTNAPIIVSLDPLSGALGSTVSITGSNFTGATGVAFNSIPAINFVVLNDQTIIVTVPNLATTGKISVSNAFGVGISTDDYTVIVPLPSITSFTPNNGVGNTLITITGTGFTSTTQVLFNGINASGFTVVDDNTITVNVPKNATNGKITVTTGGGTALSITNFIVTPSINSFTPTSGGIGTEVTIKGTNLLGTSSVQFNGIEAVIPFTIVNSTTIKATVASGTPFATNPIVITAGDANNYASVTNFTVIPTPTITSFTPSSGTFGATVTITGTDFTDVQNVTFNGVDALGFAIINATTIEAYVSQNATNGKIGVITAGGTALSPLNFTVLPAIASFDPITGGLGTIVTIYGTNIGGATAVTIGGTSVSNINPISNTELKVTVATGTTGLIEITTPDDVAISETDFVYMNAPTISNIVVTPGPKTTAGSLVTITGTNFLNALDVLINGISVSDFNINEDGTIITFDLPSNVSTGLITINGAGGTVNSVSPLVITPSIYSFTPSRGEAGTTVTITGANFNGTSAVNFNGIAATSFNVVNANTITAVISSATTDGSITVNVGGEIATSATNFDFIPAPTISLLSLNNAGVGTLITITGTNFLTGETTVKFNNTNAPTVNVLDVNTLQVNVPAGATTGQLSVSTLGGIATSVFTVNPPTPTITNFTPNQGVIGTTVSISGTNLSTTTEVRFNGTLATIINITNTLVSAVVPNGASSGQISIITDGGTANSATNFTVTLPPVPTITNFTPTNGPVGTLVTINGTNFTNASQVTFNGVNASFTVINSSQIRATVPNTTTGLINVTTSGGNVNSLTNYVVPFVWTGSVNTDWNNALNWSPNIIPNAVDVDVNIPNMTNDPILSNAVTIRNIQILSGTSLQIANAGTLTLKGSISNQGSFVSNGTLELAGTIAQDIPSSLTQVNNLIINNLLGIRLLGNINISGNINFLNGNLQLNGFIIDLGTTGSLVGEKATSRITGSVGSVVASRTGASNFLATGIDIGGLGAIVTIPNTAGLSGITVRRGHTRRGNLNKGIERYFAISPSGATDNLNASLEFDYFEEELSTLFENNLILYRFNGTSWEVKTGTIRDIANNKVSLIGIPKFSEWTAGTENLPLPISLQSFEASRKDAQTVKINWNVLLEKDLAYYEVQKSEDGTNFQTLSRKDVMTGQIFPHQYSLTDWEASNAAFYRLKIVENNLQSNYSKIVYVDAQDRPLNLKVYPNPTLEKVNISLSTLNKVQLQLTDEKGQLILLANGKLSEVEAQLNGQLSRLAKGLYIVYLKEDNQQYKSKILKQ